MSISRGVRKAAKAADVQSRGLEGKRNSQGDFVTDVDRFAASEVMARDKLDSSPIEADVQNYINDVKRQIDEIEDELSAIDTNVDTPGMTEEFQRLEAQKEDLLVELMDKLTTEGVEVPPGLQEMLMDSLTRGERRAADEADADTLEKLSTGEYEIDPMPKFL